MKIFQTQNKVLRAALALFVVGLVALLIVWAFFAIEPVGGKHSRSSPPSAKPSEKAEKKSDPTEFSSAEEGQSAQHHAKGSPAIAIQAVD